MSPGLLAWVVVLLVVNGLFVASEFAFTASRRDRIEQLAKHGNRRARWALASMQELSVTLASAQLGITMASLGLGFAAEPAVGAIIERGLALAPLPSGLRNGLALGIALLIVVIAHNIVGELTPKNLAISAPEKVALAVAGPFRLYTTAFRPLVWLLSSVSNLILALFGVRPRNEVEVAHTADDIAVMISAGRHEGYLEELAHRMLSGAILFTERDVSEVMVSRTEVVTVPATVSPAELEQTVVRTGHSRLPVTGPGGIDDVLGYVHIKDLLGIPDEERSQPIPHHLIRQAVVVPETSAAESVLKEMQRRRNHLALVIDEHGGTAGIVTMEDIVEELVGEIRDEYDREELGVRRVGMRRYLVPGTLRADQLIEPLGLRIPEGDFETVGGFVMDRLARVPKRGDTVVQDDWVIRVRRMERRRVAEVEIERRAG